MTESSTTDYVPIPCERHSDYELAVMHRRPLRLVWTEGNVIHDDVVLPLDIQTAQHEEFLVCRTRDGNVRRIRLDRVRRLEPV